ncbi:unnamed protein product [Rotaria sp. Silwood2]|nr:unnamed protein product [Rotaria sp. Silwood2]CAF4034953.1 unnamed protein product [Rotaria sp. Silwood2]
MSYSYPRKDHQKIDNKDISIHLSSNYSDNELLLSTKTSDSSSAKLLINSSLISNESSQQQEQLPNQRITRSCFRSTFIFLINFISSSLVINLSNC